MGMVLLLTTIRCVPAGVWRARLCGRGLDLTQVGFALGVRRRADAHEGELGVLQPAGIIQGELADGQP